MKQKKEKTRENKENKESYYKHAKTYYKLKTVEKEFKQV